MSMPEWLCPGWNVVVLSLPFTVSVPLCVCTWLCVFQVWALVCTYEDQGTALGLTLPPPPGIIHLLFYQSETESFPGLELSKQARLVGQLSQASACFLMPTVGKPSMDRHDWLRWVLGIKPSSSCLQGKQFINWVILHNRMYLRCLPNHSNQDSYASSCTDLTAGFLTAREWLHRFLVQSFSACRSLIWL